jgi:hypothetical protein
MGKFSIPKLIKPRKWGGTVMFRIDNIEIQNAFLKMMQESGLSGQKVLEKMVEHCLKESGYLK